MTKISARSSCKVVVYSVIFDGYDAVFPVTNKDPDVDYVLISDREPPRGSGWTLRAPPPETAGYDAAKQNRWCKFFPHRIFPEYDVSIYIDGNIQPIDPIRELVEVFMGSGAGMGLFKHPSRQSLDEELKACLALGKLSEAAGRSVSARLAHYQDNGGVGRVPFTENGVIFRRHDAPLLDDAMVSWWDEYDQVFRDQIALPWVLEHSRLSVAVWDWSYRNANPWFLGPIIPHLANLPSGLRGRFRLFAKHQKLRFRTRRTLQGFEREKARSSLILANAASGT